jgi:hypothetical protein
VKRLWLAAVLLVAACGVAPSGVDDAGPAPTGVAPGVTLYFVDAQDRLVPQLRRTDHLGSISEAVSLLLSGLPDADLHTEIASAASTQVAVTTAADAIQLQVPLAVDEVTPRGVDQIVCTALGVHVQGGGSRDTVVRIRFTLAAPESDRPRTCPLIR